MVIPVFITITETPPINAEKKVLRTTLINTHIEIERKWAVEMLPKHFDESASQTYKYQPRSPGWLKQKRKMAENGLALFGGQRDLVATGLMMNLVLGYQDITATPTGGTTKIYGPQYLWQYRKNFKQPDKAAEILQDLPGEVQALAEHGQWVYESEVAKLSGTQVTTIGK